MSEKDIDPHWGTIEQKDAFGNVVSVEEGLIIGRGETRSVINPKRVEELATTFASYRELAEFFNVREQTFRDNFRENVIKGRANTKMSLRQWQLAAAKSGNTSMLIWLGKNILGQQDNPTNKEENTILPWNNDLVEDTDGTEPSTEHSSQ